MRIEQNSMIAFLITVIISWGTTAYTYINTGFSIAMISFASFVLFEQYKQPYRPKLIIPKELILGFSVLYGALFCTTIFHIDNLKNLYGGYYCALSLLMYMIPFWMILYIGRRYDIRKIVIYVFYGILYVVCLYGIIKYFLLGEYRLTSFYGPGTRVAMMLDMFFPFTIAATLYYKQNKKFFIISLILILLEIITIILGKVRGTYLALSVAIIFIFVIWRWLNPLQMSPRMKKYMGLGVLFSIIAMGVYGLSIGWGNPHRMVGEERFLMWESSYYMWLDHPVIGIGLDEWQSLWANSEYTHPDAKEHGAVHPHNVFIYFFTTCGIIGGVAYLFYNVMLFIYLFRKIRENSKNPFSWAMMFMFIAMTVHGLVDQSFILKLTGRIFYFMLGYTLIFEEWIQRKGICKNIEA